jgi:hypothetical protein
VACVHWLRPDWSFLPNLRSSASEFPTGSRIASRRRVCEIFRSERRCHVHAEIVSLAQPIGQRWLLLEWRQRSFWNRWLQCWNRGIVGSVGGAISSLRNARRGTVGGTCTRRARFRGRGASASASAGSSTCSPFSSSALLSNASSASSVFCGNSCSAPAVNLTLAL